MQQVQEEGDRVMLSPLFLVGNEARSILGVFETLGQLSPPTRRQHRAASETIEF